MRDQDFWESETCPPEVSDARMLRLFTTVCAMEFFMPAFFRCHKCVATEILVIVSVPALQRLFLQMLRYPLD